MERTGKDWLNIQETSLFSSDYVMNPGAFKMQLHGIELISQTAGHRAGDSMRQHRAVLREYVASPEPQMDYLHQFEPVGQSHEHDGIPCP